MPYVDRKPQRETAATWGGAISLCLFCAFLSHSCHCRAHCSAYVPSPPLLSSFFPWIWCTDVCTTLLFPERPQPPDLHPKKSHSPSPSALVQCLCLHGSLNPFPAIWFYPSSPVDEISPLLHLSTIATHLLLAPWLLWRGISYRGAAPQRGRVQ